MARYATIQQTDGSKKCYRNPDTYAQRYEDNPTGYTQIDCSLVPYTRTNPTIQISKMEVAGKTLDTNTILKWAAIVAAVVLVGWYVMKKMR